MIIYSNLNHPLNVIYKNYILFLGPHDYQSDVTLMHPLPVPYPPTTVNGHAHNGTPLEQVCDAMLPLPATTSPASRSARGRPLRPLIYVTTNSLEPTSSTDFLRPLQRHRSVERKTPFNASSGLWLTLENPQC